MQTLYFTFIVTLFYGRASTGDAMENSRARLVTADDHRILCDGLRALFSLEPDLEVVGQLGNGTNAVL